MTGSPLVASEPIEELGVGKDIGVWGRSVGEDGGDGGSDGGTSGGDVRSIVSGRIITG